MYISVVFIVLIILLYFQNKAAVAFHNVFFKSLSNNHITNKFKKYSRVFYMPADLQHKDKLKMSLTQRERHGSGLGRGYDLNQWCHDSIMSHQNNRHKQYRVETKLETKITGNEMKVQSQIQLA